MDVAIPISREKQGVQLVALVLHLAQGVLQLAGHVVKGGVDNRNRKLYILDGNGVCLVSPDGDAAQLEYTENRLF